MRPVTGYAVHRECEAHCGQLLAHPPVVAVAAARAARIVDVGGDDDVEPRHRVRSKLAQATCDSCSVTATPASSRAPSPSSPSRIRSTRRSAMSLARLPVLLVVLLMRD